MTFAVPAGVSGTQTVSVSDGTSTPSPTQFTVGGTVKGTAPVGYSVSVNNPSSNGTRNRRTWVSNDLSQLPA